MVELYGNRLDEKTIHNARRGDREAQAVLLREFQDAWFRMCVGLLRDSELARDATQETGLRFLRQIATFRGGSQLRTWSIGIAINVCREMRRGNRRVPEDFGEEREEASPSNAAEKQEEAMRLREVLSGLPERQREAVMLRFFEEMSVEEAATAMDCAPGTVKATIHQALRAMKKRLVSWS